MSRLLARIAIAALLAGVAGAADPDSGVLQLGDVPFPHERHYSDLEIECVTCHHETAAPPLQIPHADYFDDFWIDCATCHSRKDTGQRACASCHHARPANLSDETLSAKVVVHKSCWTCHEIGTGPSASRGCRSCHTAEPGRTDEGSRG